MYGLLNSATFSDLEQLTFQTFVLLPKYRQILVEHHELFVFQSEMIGE